MRSLYVRIWLTVVAALLLFALIGGWLVSRTLEEERGRFDSAMAERFAAWGELIQRSLPGTDAPADEQAAALRDWSQRLRLPLALDDEAGRRIAAAEAFERREREQPNVRTIPIRLEDGRTLWLMRGGFRGPRGGPRDGPHGLVPWLVPPGWRGVPGIGLALLLGLLFAAVAAGAYPVVRRLTRRLEALQRGVEAFGEGALHQRVAEGGRDEVAKLAASFNRAAARIEALLRSHQSLLANASHELRSPLARLKLALSMLDEAGGERRAALQREIATDIAELDALVEEILLASRLDARPAAAPAERDEPVDLLALAAEEAARSDAQLDGEPLQVLGDERLLRRALRNLLENARRYGGDSVDVTLRGDGAHAVCRVCDRGPGVPEPYRERIFEPFFRLPGHAEREGGVGLGLALVRQIAERHRGRAHCEPRDGGGSCFVLTLPLARG